MNGVLYIALEALKEVSRRLEAETGTKRDYYLPSSTARHYYLKGRIEGLVEGMSMLSNLEPTSPDLSADMMDRYRHLIIQCKSNAGDYMAKYQQEEIDAKNCYRTSMIYYALIEALALMMNHRRQNMKMAHLVNAYERISLDNNMWDHHDCLIDELTEWELAKDLKDGSLKEDALPEESPIYYDIIKREVLENEED